MRQIGSITEEVLARKFAAYLLTQGIGATTEPDGEQWDIWVRDEDHLVQARTELEKFVAAPHDERYQGVESRADSIQRQESEDNGSPQENVAESQTNWKRRSRTPRRRPMTFTLIFVFVALGFLTQFGSYRNQQTGEESIAARALKFRDPNLKVNATTASETDETPKLSETFDSIKRGEVWRLITPMFLHGSVDNDVRLGMFHLFINMYILFYFGSMIEDVYGQWRYLLLILALALLSNILQAILVGSDFVGTSGVVYGLFGYAMMKAMFEPDSGVYVSQFTAIIFLAWIGMGLAGVEGIGMPGENRLATWAHAGGLVAGVACGFLPWWVRQQLRGN